MYPILFSLGPISIYTSHLFAIFGWCVFSFLFWKELRSQGILEERIFDLTFYGTVVGGLFARIGFVILYPQLFQPSVLLIGAFWVQPGLWLYSGLLGVLLTFYYLSKKYNIRFAHVFDAFAISLPWTLIPISLGLFFQGSELGRVSNAVWALGYPAIDGKRHPVQLYEVIALLLLGFITIILHKRSLNKKWSAGLLGATIFTLITPVLFSLEFFKEARVYIYGITVNQWILILVFAESMGSLIIKLRFMEKLFSKRGVKHDTTDTHKSEPTDGIKGETPKELPGEVTETN